jgi:hypothetical protein
MSGASSIHRFSPMNADPGLVVARATAAEYASWFRALADPTRAQILSLLPGAAGR